jgi:hypothetical protein
LRDAGEGEHVGLAGAAAVVPNSGTMDVEAKKERKWRD